MYAMMVVLEWYNAWIVGIRWCNLYDCGGAVERAMFDSAYNGK